MGTVRGILNQTPLVSVPLKQTSLGVLVAVHLATGRCMTWETACWFSTTSLEHRRHSWCGPAVCWAIHVVVALLWTYLLGPVAVSVPSVVSTLKRAGEKSRRGLSRLMDFWLCGVYGWIQLCTLTQPPVVGGKVHLEDRLLFEPFEGNQVTEGVLFMQKQSVPKDGHSSPLSMEQKSPWRVKPTSWF